MLCADEKTKYSYLVAVTGLGQEEDRRRAAEAGFDRHVTKPADQSELLAMMAEVSATASRSPAAGGC